MSIRLPDEAARIVQTTAAAAKRKDVTDPNKAPHDDINVPSIALSSVKGEAFAYVNTRLYCVLYQHKEKVQLLNRVLGQQAFLIIRLVSFRFYH